MSAPKSSPSRRATLLAFAGVAAGGALPLAAAAPAAAGPIPSAEPPLVPSPLNGGPAPAPGARLPMLIDPTDPWHFTAHPAGALTTRATAGGLEVSDSKGVLATLTTGASTVTVRGPKRWFTEQKRTVTDAFDRTLTTGVTGWGQSPDGGSWSPNSKDDANVGDYKVEAGRGVITLGTAGSSRHSVLSDKNLGDVRARARFSFDKKPTGAPLSLALTFSLSALSTHYRARLIVTPAGDVQLTLEKALNDEVTVLAPAVTVGTGFAAFDHWWVQVEKAGDVLRARAWKNGETTPDWRFSLRDPSPDTALGAGTVGVRAQAATGAATGVEARVYDFLVEEATWVDPPVITHDTWVRVLPEPFDGSWTPAVEQRVRAWAGDLSPDALAYAAMFLPSAPAVTRVVNDGDGVPRTVKVLGTSQYSKPSPDTGERTVGADFQEYMGISWAFPGFPTRAPEAPFLNSLDCSGFVRMVYGFHMGLPLLHENAAPDHRGLPRTSTRQAKDGPGVIVADGGTAVPPLDGLRIGDTVFFDSDTDPEAGGHIGIYLGEDHHGYRRFFSSRKTPNGPTLADVGGRSVLNGTSDETYTDKLRVIRRF
ncbi:MULTISPECIES: NlpC/P60 family protein [unclassified Streptomyces]|uniref:NlpC/P60 family protein n=1 Tax=unclassified Streptomyces TaxID=2593676 RepID=UPI002E31CAC9|nr:NlpC/P60 family protein [Streptomyces sp. NBC_01268]